MYSYWFYVHCAGLHTHTHTRTYALKGTFGTFPLKLNMLEYMKV